ncbi:MAG TPA: hypothetical protein VGP71_11020 [Burkholderiales bacterium]|nr:hypothetical protein [Burkholderiales bacterium]
MEYAKACALENDKKIVAVSGFLSPGVSVFCSNHGGRMECGFTFAETADAKKGFSADIEQGSGANTVDKLKSGYRREDVKIRDSAGNVINLAEKVKLTGKMNVTPDLSVCFLQVTKIER